ncbi:unnamed protein product [Schistocephalus solidus]|uniref:Reverse transcriptase domain-containing protein n=1 Tax=Schistocephalus solidus TaxID=70667 RepID=A0A183SLF5_SCHSO|nr:unnamed protein product [Schistocephalus solidus]
MASFDLEKDKGYDDLHSVNHQRFLYKLNRIGVRGKLLKWIEIFLIGRSQIVRLGDQQSAEVAVESGVAQGSVLDPILILICIYDCLTGLAWDTAMLDDDIKLWKVIQSADDEENRQANLHRLEEWSKNWLLPFNATKFNILRFGRTSSGHQRIYYLDDTPLSDVEAQKDLDMAIPVSLVSVGPIISIKMSSRFATTHEASQDGPRFLVGSVASHDLGSFNDNGLLLMCTYAECHLLLNKTSFAFRRGRRPRGYTLSRGAGIYWTMFSSGGDIESRNQINEKLENLHSPDNSVTVKVPWCQLRNVIQSTTLEVVGRARCQHKVCFHDTDADNSNLLDEKNGLHKAYMDFRTDATKSAFFRCLGLAQQRLREIQDTRMIRKTDEFQGKITILKRWAEYFRNFHTCLSAISNVAIDRLPQVDTNNALDLPPSLLKTIRAVQQICSGKVPGSGAILPEVYKHGGPRLMAESRPLFQEMWCQGQVPQDSKDATIVHLYKRKGNLLLCDNHRCISLLNIAKKIFARMLLNPSQTLWLNRVMSILKKVVKQAV